MNDKFVTITGLTVKHETDAALLVETADGEEVWLPLSQVEAVHNRDAPGAAAVEVARWIAERKGLL